MWVQRTARVRAYHLGQLSDEQVVEVVDVVHLVGEHAPPGRGARSLSGVVGGSSGAQAAQP